MRQRLRYAYGDHDTPLTPTPEATAHVLGFPTEAAANDCRGVLTRDAQSLLIRPRGARGWQLYAIYPELPPDQGFHERKRQLGQTAARFGGTYDGSQDPLR